MSEHIGEVGKRVELTVKLTKEYSFASYFGYNQSTTIYTMEDEHGNIIVWKTNGYMKLESVNSRGDIETDLPRKGDIITLKATVKEHGEYKGTLQTVLTRVKVTAISHAPTKEEIDAAKAKEQIASIADGDFIWRMPYKQYKDHYSDCETIAGSFHRTNYETLIDVIVRKGRLVPSGVRGKHFRGYELQIDDHYSCFRAVSLENAIKQCRTEFPEAKSITLRKIY